MITLWERERERKAISHNFLRSSCILFNFFENNNELLEYNKWGTDDDGDDDSLIKQKWFLGVWFFLKCFALKKLLK
jgi:hypothetical protein